MKDIKVILVGLAGLLALVSAGYIVKQNLETRKGAAGDGNLDFPSEVEICLGDTGTVSISGSADQKITGYTLTLGFDGSKVEVKDVNAQWSIKDGNLNISSLFAGNPRDGFEINVSLKGKELGSSSFSLVDSWMGGVDDPDMPVSDTGPTTIKVIDCEGPADTPVDTPTETPPDGGEEVTISQPSSLQICRGETETISVSGTSGTSLSGFELYFGYNSSMGEIEDVTFDDNWRDGGGWSTHGGELSISSTYAASGPPQGFTVDIRLKGNETGRFNFGLDAGSSIVADASGQRLDINYSGGTAVLIQDCEGPTDTPEPTPTGEVGCKPCPDGSFVESRADYDCDGDVDMEDFAGWYDDYKLGSQNLYGDFNCNGQLDQGDVNQWYEELPKFE